MKSNWWYKTQWYLLSMWLFAVIVLVLTLHIPICFDTDSHFIGFGKLWELNGMLPILAIVIISFNIWFLLYTLRYENKGTKGLSRKITLLEPRNGDALSFLASYFVPLVSFQMDSCRHAIVLGALFMAIGIMYVRGNMFHMNPSLLLLGFKLYEIRIEGADANIIVLCHGDLQKNDSIKLRHITETLCVGSKL